MIGQPPTAMRKQQPVVIPPPSRSPGGPARSTPTTPTKQRTAPPGGFAGYPAYPAQPAPVYPAGYGASSGRPSGERERERAPGSRKVTPMFN